MSSQKMSPNLLSVAIITFQEEDRILRCLESVSFADEIIVLDSGSTDKTRALAKEYGATVFTKEFEGHTQQKNMALSYCTHPWILCIDADEWLSPQLSSLIQLWLSQPQKSNGLTLCRRSLWLGHKTKYGLFGFDYPIRLIRSGKGYWGGDNPHDTLIVEGDVHRTSEVLWHDPYRSFEEHLETIRRYTRISSQAQKGGVLDLVFRPPAHFFKAYILKLGILDGPIGLLLAILGSYYVGLKYFRCCMRSS